MLAVIPARGGSKGLPGKNTRRLFGLPLIVHSIRAAELTPADHPVRRVHRLGGDRRGRPAASAARHPSSGRPSSPATTRRWRPSCDTRSSGARPTRACRYDAVLLLDPTSPARVPGAARRRRPPCSSTTPSSTASSACRSRPSTRCGWGSAPPGRPTVRCSRFFDSGAGVTRRQDADRFLRINGNFYLWRVRLRAPARDVVVRRGHARRGRDPGVAGLLDRRRVRVPAHRGAHRGRHHPPALDRDGRPHDATRSSPTSADALPSSPAAPVPSGRCSPTRLPRPGPGSSSSTWTRRPARRRPTRSPAAGT